MPSTDHPLRSFVAEPLLWTLKDDPPAPPEEVIFTGQTTTTPSGTEEYTASLPDLPPAERMTHWLTVDTDHVVSLKNYR